MTNPIIPMAVFSGSPTKSDISEYLKAIHSAGIDEIMFYPRKGCELEYMSEKWFEAVGNVLDVLSSLGMGVWINDDFHFPSGNAGGKVTSNDDYCLRSITVVGENKGRRNFVTADTPPEKRFADVLGYEAIDAFISESHARYYDVFGDYFGGVIRGFYTDEPSAGYFCGEDDIPYYVGMEDDYKLCFGRDFDADLAAEYEAFQQYCFELIGKRFTKCYSEQISNWCISHGVVLTGHLFEDHSPMRSSLGSGDITKALPQIMLPGIDDINTDFEKPFLFSLLGIADYAKTARGAMAELFALGPCDMPYSKQTAMIYLCSSFGINHFFLAVSHINMKGNRPINNYFSHFGPDRPDFEGMRELCRRAEDAAALSDIGFKPEVYIEYPIKLYTHNMTTRRRGDAPDDGSFWNFINALTFRQIQWKYISEDENCTSDIPVVSFARDGATMLCGKPAPQEEILASLSKKPRVTGLSGELPEKIFVRKRADGGLTVINLSDFAQTLLIDGEKTTLFGYDVYTDPRKQYDVISTLTEGTVSLKYGNQNKARLMFINDETKAEIECEDDFTVTFSVREECDAFLDGIPLVCERCDSLGKGFDELYKNSKKIKLSKGVHTVTSGNDYKYLPSVIVSGNFSVRYVSGEICRVILSKRISKTDMGRSVSDHGEMTLSVKVAIPVKAEKIRVFGKPLHSKIFIGEKELCSGISSPLTFDIPRGMRGKRVIKLRAYSSLGSLFGDTDYFNYHQSSIRWRSTLPSHPSEFGIDRIEFLK